MPYETLRFLQAARVFVDHPLSETGPISPELRGFVRGATSAAFRRVIDACLEHAVDFLLLTGDTLDQSDFSIKARVELRDGFEQLADAGIQVFLIPGPSDPAAVWDDFPDLPNNVTVFHPETDDPVAVIRDGAVIASIRSLSWRRSWFTADERSDDPQPRQRRPLEADELERADPRTNRAAESPVSASGDSALEDDSASDSFDTAASTNETPARREAHRETRRVHSPADLRPNHFAIAIVRDGIDPPSHDPQVDYLAVVGGRERRTLNGNGWLMHFPGGTQGLSPNETGVQGCTLVDLDGDGVIRCRLLPTSTVRWEEFDIDIDTETTTEQLVQQLQAACRGLCGHEERKVVEFGDAPDHEPTPSIEQLHAQACFLRWTIRGCGPLFQSLFSEATRSELIDWLDDDAVWPLEIPRLHRFRLLAAEPDVSRSASNTDGDQLDISAEFFRRVDQAQPLGSSAWNAVGQEAAVTNERLARVQVAAPGCDADVVLSLARRQGWTWLGQSSRVTE
jgi:DNA repair exonuclease SbcCD nuclease subunit